MLSSSEKWKPMTDDEKDAYEILAVHLIWIAS